MLHLKHNGPVLPGPHLKSVNLTGSSYYGGLAIITMHVEHRLRSIALRPNFSVGLPLSFENQNGKVYHTPHKITAEKDDMKNFIEVTMNESKEAKSS